MPSSSAANEPRVGPTAPMPAGYRFVRKGSVYITAHCRRLTHAAGASVYVVADPPSSTSVLGIRVPSHIHRRVQQAERESRAARREKVKVRDDAVSRVFEAEVRRLFPRIPEGVVAQVARHALLKRSGRVGRTGKMEVEQKARLAVVAHVRHCHTPYDALLKGGMLREEARGRVWRRVNEIADLWAGRKGKGEGKKKENALETTMTTSARVMTRESRDGKMRGAAAAVRTALASTAREGKKQQTTKPLTVRPGGKSSGQWKPGLSKGAGARSSAMTTKSGNTQVPPPQQATSVANKTRTSPRTKTLVQRAKPSYYSDDDDDEEESSGGGEQDGEDDEDEAECTGPVEDEEFDWQYDEGDGSDDEWIPED